MAEAQGKSAWANLSNSSDSEDDDQVDALGHERARPQQTKNLEIEDKPGPVIKTDVRKNSP
jgi:hypothetical protein